MAKEKLEIIKEAVISNNCPECFNQDMTLRFYQKHLYSKLHHRTTSDVEHQIMCNKCQSIIYPVKWTNDIERIFEYYQKTVEPQKSSIRFTALFYGIIIGLIAIAGLVYYLYSEGTIQF
ncbi:MAG: hypothetical protein ACR2MM_12740 [Flavobacteriaceae bacterium]